MAARWLVNLSSLGLLIYLLFFHGLGERELWSSHEARAAQDAQSILDGGDWRLPRLMDGRAELQKPPLYYWLTALIARCRGGVDTVAVRLPATGGALLTALAVYVLLRQLARPRAGLLASLMVLTMVHFTWMGRVGRIDMPLTAATTWSLVGFLLGGIAAARHRPVWLLLGYLSLAAGLMLKGPIAVVLVGVVLGILALCSALPAHRFPLKAEPPPPPEKDESGHQAPDERTSRLCLAWVSLARSTLWGVPLVAVLVLPWCYWVNESTAGGFVQEFLIKHNFHRGLGGDEQLDAHVHPWWFYLARLWFDTAPWGLLLPAALWWCGPRRTPLAVWGAAWFGGILGCLSLLQYKRADYLLPAYPGLAILMGVAADGWLTIAPNRLRAWALRAGVLLLAGLAVSWFGYTTWVLPALEPRRALEPFAQTVRHYLPRPGQVILFRVDSHHLTWELGKSVERIWEWENLGWWATRPAPVYVVMPRKFAEECADQLPEGRLLPIADNGEHECPLVLLVNDAGRVVAGR